MEAALKRPAVVARSRISQGRHSNTSYLELFAHTGTHIDAPWHFVEDGYKIEDFPIEAFVFSRVLIVEIEAESWKPIPLSDLLPYRDELDRSDCLLIYSGFSEKRRSDAEHYVEATPGLSLEAAKFLNNFGNLRCVGVDFISIENVKKGRDIGFPIHHALLSGPTQRILLEDADLSLLLGKKIKKVYLFPLRMTGIEASPVTAVAEVG
jgi:kynurenine formamidase